MKTKGKIAKFKITFPDGTPKEQIKQIKSIMGVFKSLSKLAGEKVDLTPFKDKIQELKNED